MCVSAWPAFFSKTITGTWEVLVEERVNHVLWYQNNVGRQSEWVPSITLRHYVEMALNITEWRDILQSSIDRELEKMIVREAKKQDSTFEQNGPPPRQLSGNCLIIPLLGTWESIKLLNTTDTLSLLSNIKSAVKLPQKTKPKSLQSEVSSGGGGAVSTRVAFLQFDIYDIILAENPKVIPQYLPGIQERKRPEVNPEVFNLLAEWYQCPVAVCCFDNFDKGEAKPLGFAFEPIFPDKLMVYTLDGHDGKAPSSNAIVELDHTIFVGSYKTPPEYCAKVSYLNDIPDHLRPYVLEHVMGRPIDGSLKNGDFVFPLENIRAGNFEGLRCLPPNAPGGDAAISVVKRDEPYIARNR